LSAARARTARVVHENVEAAERRDHDFGAGIEKALRDGRADAARPAGDQGTAAGEFFREIEFVGHEMFLRRWVNISGAVIQAVGRSRSCRDGRTSLTAPS
jgi:hypothetical protein